MLIPETVVLTPFLYITTLPFSTTLRFDAGCAVSTPLIPVAIFVPLIVQNVQYTGSSLLAASFYVRYLPVPLLRRVKPLPSTYCISHAAPSFMS